MGHPIRCGCHNCLGPRWGTRQHCLLCNREFPYEKWLYHKCSHSAVPPHPEESERPEDAPKGPWEIGSTTDQDAFMLVKRFVVKRGPYGWKEAVAVRDRLNRKGDET